MKLRPEQEISAAALVQGLPLFSGCPVEALQAMVKYLHAKEYAAGRVLLMDQEIARTLFILVKGSVSVWKRIGGEKRQLATLRAPDFFGERSMFEESPASAIVKSESICQVYVLERSQFEEVAAQFPGIREAIRKSMEEVRQKRLGPTVAPSDPDPS